MPLEPLLALSAPRPAAAVLRAPPPVGMGSHHPAHGATHTHSKQTSIGLIRNIYTITKMIRWEYNLKAFPYTKTEQDSPSNQAPLKHSSIKKNINAKTAAILINKSLAKQKLENCSLHPNHRLQVEIQQTLQDQRVLQQFTVRGHWNSLSSITLNKFLLMAFLLTTYWTFTTSLH